MIFNYIKLIKHLTHNCFCFWHMLNIQMPSDWLFLIVDTAEYFEIFIYVCLVLTTWLFSCYILVLSFLSGGAGMIDCPGTQDGSSLRSLIDKPPVCGNSFSPLTGALLTGFRLHTGPVTQTSSKVYLYCFQYSHSCLVLFSQLPEQYRLMHIQPPKKKSKHKHKHHRPQDPLPQGMASILNNTCTEMSWI